MTALTITLLSIIAFPVIIGYTYGRNNIDPNTYRGKVYYSLEVDE